MRKEALHQGVESLRSIKPYHQRVRTETSLVTVRRNLLN
jgi:hypothetical protein